MFDTPQNILKTIIVVCTAVIIGGGVWLLSPKNKTHDTVSSSIVSPSDTSSLYDSSSNNKSSQSQISKTNTIPQPAETGTITKDESGDTITMDRQNFNLIGRFLQLQDEPQWYTSVWTGATIEFSFTGSQAACYLSGEDPESTTKSVFIGVFVDGADLPHKILKVTDEGWYTVVENLEPTNHIVRIYRLVEPIGGQLRFSKIKVKAPGTLCKPPVLPEMKLEIIGDSITAGYGNGAAKASDPFRLDQENGYMTYGAILGRKMNAQVHILGWSGIGVYQNNDGKKVNTMTTLYWLTAPNVNRREKWNFENYQPDVIIVNLGTNDMASNAPKTEFISSYVKFVQQIRTNNPKALILCTMGVMGTRLVPAMEEAVKQITDAGDKSIYSIPLAEQLLSDGYGADGHPSIATHKKMADFFYMKIQELLK